MLTLFYFILFFVAALFFFFFFYCRILCFLILVPVFNYLFGVCVPFIAYSISLCRVIPKKFYFILFLFLNVE